MPKDSALISKWQDHEVKRIMKRYGITQVRAIELIEKHNGSAAKIHQEMKDEVATAAQWEDGIAQAQGT